jgi:Golgi phosphoprotein 3 (GPP34)
VIRSTTGVKTLSELAEFVDALADFCSVNPQCTGFYEAIDVMTRFKRVTLTPDQVNQVLAAVAEALPARGAKSASAIEDIHGWVADHGDPNKALTSLLTYASGQLHEQVQAEPKPPTPAIEVRESPVMRTRTLALPECFYLLAHNPRTGGPLLPPRVSGVGLSAAVLAELLIAGRVAVHTDTQKVRPIWVEDQHAPWISAVAARVQERIREEKAGAVLGQWLAYLAPEVSRQIRDALIYSGVLETRPRRALLARAYHAPTDPNLAHAVNSAALMPLWRGEAPGASNAVLLGLVKAAGLDAGRYSVWGDLGLMPTEAAGYTGTHGEVITILLDHVATAVNTAVTTQRI